MKKSIIILLIIISTNVFSQFTNGIIIKGKDTTKVTFKLPKNISNNIDYLRLQNKVKYFNALDEKFISKPEEIDEIQFSYEGEKIRMISRLEPVQPYCSICIRRTIFFKILIDDGVRLFKWH